MRPSGSPVDVEEMDKVVSMASIDSPYEIRHFHHREGDGVVVIERQFLVSPHFSVLTEVGCPNLPFVPSSEHIGFLNTNTRSVPLGDNFKDHVVVFRSVHNMRLGKVGKSPTPKSDIKKHNRLSLARLRNWDSLAGHTFS